MKTVARLSAEDRSDLFRNTANRMQMSDAIVEKDFWVCFTLDYLFHRSPWKDSITISKWLSGEAMSIILFWGKIT